MIKHIDENGNEYWYARELQNVLDYKRWNEFCNALESAQIACGVSNNNVSDHFSHLGKMVNIGSNTLRNIVDYKLSKNVCRLTF